MSERDKFLTEAMGEVWRVAGTTYESMYQIRNSHNFSTPNGFFKLWNFCKQQTFWLELYQTKLCINSELVSGLSFYCFMDCMIDPDRFADSVYEFLRGKV